MSKSIKYIFSFILFLIAFFLGGEVYNEHLFSFQNQYPETSVYLQPGQKQSDLCSDIINSAKNNSVYVFVNNTELGNDNISKIHIYCTDGTQKILSEQDDVKDGLFTSFLLDPINVEFSSMDKLPSNPNGIFMNVIGDWDDVRNFKIELVDKYAGKMPTKGTKNTNSFTIYAIWTIIFFIIILFTLFENYCFEKEKTIRIVNGNNVVSIIAKKFIVDVSILTGLFIIAYIISSFFCYSLYQWKKILIIFFISIIVDASCYLLLLRFDIKKGFSNAIVTKNIITFLCIAKTIVCVCVIIAFSLITNSLYESFSFLQQDTFFETNKDLNYIYIIGDQIDTSESGINEFFNNYNDICDKFYQEYNDRAVITDYLLNISDYRIMNMNSTALEKNKGNIKFKDGNNNIDEIVNQKKKAVLIPQHLPNSIKNDVLRLINDDTEVTFIEYTKFHTVCIGSDHDFISSFEKKPIVLLNYSYSTPTTILYQLSDEEINHFFYQFSDSQENWRYIKDSAYNIYEVYRTKAMKMSVIYISLMIALVIIVGLIIISITRMFFATHKIELALKYCMGYHFINFLFYPIIINAIVACISLIISIILSFTLAINRNQSNLLYGTILIVLTDILSLLALYYSFIKKNIIQIIKGRFI